MCGSLETSASSAPEARSNSRSLRSYLSTAVLSIQHLADIFNDKDVQNRSFELNSVTVAAEICSVLMENLIPSLRNVPM